jgi:ATP-binding cassette, subfamily A (ABC1), member 3
MGLSPLFWLSLAIILDYRVVNKLKTNKIEEEAIVRKYQVLDTEGVKQSTDIACKVDDKIAIQAQKISKVYPIGIKKIQFFALKDVSIYLNKNETLGLLGPNGAGKSTLFNILSTHVSADDGKILSFGQKLDAKSDLFKNTGLVAQEDLYWISLDVDTNIKIMRILKGIPKAVAETWKRVLYLDHSGKINAEHLSTGMKRKLCFIMGCISNPEFKFLDEPGTGVDPVAKLSMRDIIQEQKKAYGSSSILTTHSMGEAEEICDRIAIMLNGNMCLMNSIHDIKRLLGGYNITVYTKKQFAMEDFSRSENGSLEIEINGQNGNNDSNVENDEENTDLRPKTRVLECVLGGVKHEELLNKILDALG